MRVLANMNIIVPCDGPQTADAVMTAVNTPGPFYIRLGRSKTPTIENKGEFKFGKAQVLSEGNDATIVACGIMVSQALAAVKNLAAQGKKVRLINMHSVRPLDNEMILKAAKETKLLVVCEEHNIIGGLASSIDEVVAENYPVKVIRVGVRNRFGQSGESDELLKEYGLSASDIEKAVLSNLS
jgi:transketolase